MYPERIPARRLGLLLVAGLTLLWGAHGAPPERKPSTQEHDALYKWFSLPFRVEELPTGAEFVPVATTLDLSNLVTRLKIPGVVDPRSLRLVGPTGDVPFQFTATLQPRLVPPRLLPGTTPAVSYTGEVPAGVTPEGPRVQGELAWAVVRPTERHVQYELRFGVLRQGSHVQAPYGPRDLRAFDASGRATPIRLFPSMQIHPQWPLAGQVHLQDQGRLVTSYHHGPTAARGEAPGFTPRRPFFYPVHGPDGIGLTEFGKPHDPTGSHAHHYSLWVAHSSVGGHDFWSEKGGRIVHNRFERQEDGPVFCRLEQSAGWWHDGRELLRERRTITLHQTPEDFRLLDLDFELTPAGVAVVLGKTTFGFLAARVVQSMTVFDGGGEILTATGARNERAAHRSRAAWLDQSGPIAPGRWGGIAILDHPANPHHPTMWHCRNDGWAGAAFNGETARTLQPGEKLRLRYRVHLHRHDAQHGRVAVRFAEYAARPMVRLGEPTARRE